MKLNRAGIALLSLASAFLPLCTDGFLAAIQPMRQEFGVSFAAAQSTISIVLLGFACAQLVIGALADRYGRRPVLTLGILCFLFATVGDALASSLPALLVFRFIQGASAATGPILARAIVRDLYDRRDGAHVLSVVSMGLAVIPLFLPGLNAAIVSGFGWRASTVLPGLLLLVSLYMTRRYLRETLRPEAVAPLSLRALSSTFIAASRQRRIVGYILCCVSGYGGLAVWISSSPHLLSGWYGRPATSFGLYWGCTMLAYITGGYGSVRLLRRYTSDRILALGSHLLLVSAALLALCVWCAPHSLALFLMGIGLYCAGWSMLQPHAQTGALAAFPESAGRISALLGFAQLTGGAVIAQLFGLLHDGTPLAAAGLIGACALMNGVLRRGLCPSPSVSALGLR